MLTFACGGPEAEPEGSEAATAVASTSTRYVSTSYRVVASNDLGMHCYDSDFSVFSLLPPFNNLHAQVVDERNHRLMTSADVTLRYSAVADLAGKANTTSRGKTNFWTYAPALFGASLAQDTGLLGQKMPGSTNTPQTFSQYDAAHGWFAAPGIPVAARDDSGAVDYYPMFRVEAVSRSTGAVLGSTDVVAPVSDEMGCSSCHQTGQSAASAPGVAWSQNTNLQLQYRENVLTLHDLRVGTHLASMTPVLCASCHYSPALDLTGAGPSAEQSGNLYLSQAMHGRHGRDLAGTGTATPIVPDTRAGCYSCHPGSVTKCLRGAMGNAGLSCQDCHGGMRAVAGAVPRPGGVARTPWLDEPGCQSCHTGDAVNHVTVAGAMAADGIRLLRAYDPTDAAAVPRTAPTSRFAENARLYRLSNGHGGVFCEGCHGSTHAEWPSSTANDNVAAQQAQGHTGVIAECSSCHNPVPLTTTGGPHGMHTIGQPWVGAHHDRLSGGTAPCQACHGLDYRGTALSKTRAARSFSIEGRTVRFAAGQPIGCYSCHNGPRGD